MGAVLLLLAGVGLFAAGTLLPLRWAFALLTTAVVLVPATLVVPNGVTPLPTQTGAETAPRTAMSSASDVGCPVPLPDTITASAPPRSAVSAAT